MGRAPVMPEVSALRKCDCRNGVVRVVPERMTKNSSTMEPARRRRASGARAAPVSEKRFLLAGRAERVGEWDVLDRAIVRMMSDCDLDKVFCR